MHSSKRKDVHEFVHLESLIEMIDELDGDTYDMLGLTELKELLGGK